MPYSRPTLTQLRSQAAADIASSVRGTDGLLRFTNLGVLGDLVAKACHALFGYQDWIARQAVPFTAKGEYLEGWAALKGVTRKPATAATGTVTLVGPPGVVVPAVSAVVRADGLAYSTVQDVTFDGTGSATAAIIATVTGSIGNASTGVTLTLSPPIGGVTSAGVGSELTDGADVELDADLRTRMLQRYAAVPQGGAAPDYVDWALAAPGVTQAWCAPNAMGAGTVVVYAMLDEAEAAHGGFPQGSDGCAAAETRGAAATGDQLAIANAIFPLQPVTALVTVVSPIANTVEFTISLPGATTALKAAIDAAIALVLQTRGSPGGTVPISFIEAAVSAISGSTGFVITAIAATHGSVTPGAAGNISSNTGCLPVASPSTWV